MPPAAVLPEPASVEPATLSDMMDDKHIISDASESLLEYIQRNACFKAMAITIMTTAITKWGCSILEAASQAADCCGFSSKTVRQWASSFVVAYTPAPDNITDKFITEQLSIETLAS